MDVVRQLEVSADHPFGEEQQVCARLLFKFLCNNIYLGQWELARACIQELHKHSDELNVSINSLFKTLSQFPHGCSLGSSSIRSPHHLSWLCLHELDSIKPVGEENVSIEKDAEFRLLLVEACQEAPVEIIKELYQYHRTAFGSDLTPLPCDRNPVTSLSTATQHFLATCLQKTPALGAALLRALTVDGENYRNNDELLQNIHIRSIQEILKKIQILGRVYGNQELGDDRNEDLQHLRKKFFDLLVLFNPPDTMKNLPLRSLFIEILQTSGGDSAPLRYSDVYSSLLGRPTDFLIKEFCGIEYETKIGGPELRIAGGLKDFDSLLLALCRLTDRSQAWKEMYLFCINEEKHFLDCVMESCQRLIQQERFEDLQVVLSTQELRPLQPLVLLIGMEHVSSTDSARVLLEILSDSEVCKRQPLLKQGMKNLAFQVELVEWCLEKASPLLHAPSSFSKRASDLLHELETHSILYVLHQATRLDMLQEKDVFHLMNKHMAVHSSTVSDSSAKESVTFSKEDLDCDDEEVSAAPCKVEHHRDIALYRSFCAIKSFMDAIHFCADTTISRKLEMSKLRSRDSSHDSLSQSAAAKISIQEDSQDHEISKTNQVQESLQMLYSENVMARLQAGREHLSKLHPLTYRVEVLENVFSLLFLTHENIQDVTTSWQQSDSGEEGVEETRSPNTSLLNENTDGSTVSQSDNFSSLETSVECENWEASKTLQCEDVSTIDSTIILKTNNKTTSDSTKTQRVYNKHEDSAELAYHTTTFKSEMRELSSDAKKNLSGNLSTLSMASMGGSSYKLGFVANEFLVRDLLAVLKESLADLGAAKYRLYDQKPQEMGTHKMDDHVNVELEKYLCRSLNTSVSVASLQQRITRLTQYIHEATWRFQLVSHDYVPKETGSVATETCNDGYSDEEEWDRDLHDTEEEGVFQGTHHGKRSPHLSADPKSGKKSPLTMSSSAAESESQHATDASMNSTGSQESGRRRRRHLRRRSSRSAHVMRWRQGIIPRMLASEGSLLNMALRRANFTQARQVIKLFNMAEKPISFEVIFGEKYQIALNKLHQIDQSASIVPSSKSRPRLAFTRPGISAIAKVAAAGVASVTGTSVVDQVLSSATLPSLPTEILEELELKSPSALSGLIRQEHVSAMIVLDLAIVGPKAWESSHNLMEMAEKRLPAVDRKVADVYHNKEPTETETKKSSTVKGIVGMLNLMLSRLALGTSDLAMTNPEVSEKYYKLSANQFLLNAILPVGAKELKAYVASQVDLRKVVGKVEKALGDIGQSERRIIDDSGKKTPLGHEKPVVRIAMKHLLKTFEKHLPPEGITGNQLKDVCSIVLEDWDFVQAMYDHVKAFAGLLQEWDPSSKDPSCVEYFKLLQQSPTHILGRLLFISKVPPTRLEDMASKLHLDLTEIIVKSCCPAVPVQRSKITHHTDTHCENGRMILNKNDQWSATARDPEVVVSELLTKLLQIMRETALSSNAVGVLNFEAAQVALQRLECCQILLASQELQTVDLRRLQMREHRLCFYGNLLNLMYIHTCLHIVKEKLNKEAMKNSCSESPSGALQAEDTVLPSGGFQRLLVENKMTYIVGQLGQVSIFELKYLILRSGLKPPSTLDGLISGRIQGLDSLDPWHLFGPQHEPRMLFVLSDGCVSSPPLQVLAPSLLEQQLETSMRDYLAHNVMVDKEQLLVALPELLTWYSVDFAAEKLRDFEEEYEGLLKFVAFRLPGPAGQDLQFLLDEQNVYHSANIDKTGRDELFFKVQVDRFDTEFSYVFDYETKRHPRPLMQRQRSRSLPLGLESSSGDFTLQRLNSTENESETNYNLTPLTLEYLKQSSALVATLVSMVCSDEMDDIEHALTEDHFTRSADLGGEMTESSNSTMDIRSYRYERLVLDFPVLRNYIVQHVLPLVGAQNPQTARNGDSLLKLTSQSIDRKIRACMLAMYDNTHFQRLLHGFFRDLALERNWATILDLLQCIPQHLLVQDADLLNLKDFILCCASTYRPSDCSDEMEETNWRYLHQIHNKDTQARGVLGSLKHWSVDVCVDLLELCSSSHLLNNDLAEAIKVKLEIMKIYQKITVCAKELKTKLSAQDSLSSQDDDAEADVFLADISELESLTRWQQVVDLSAKKPLKVLEVLTASHEFEMARRWARMHHAPMPLRQSIKESYIVYLLEQKKPDVMQAYQVLEEQERRDKEGCLAICRNVLERVAQRNIQFVADFMLSHLGALLDDQEVVEVKLLSLGAQCLLVLPEHIREQYQHLLTAPIILLEQLFMNMKIEWARLVMGIMKKEIASLGGALIGCDTDAVNALVTTYATKALEFPVIDFAYPLVSLQRQASVVSLGGVQTSQRRFSLQSENIKLPVAVLRRSSVTPSPTLAKQHRMSLPAGALNTLQDPTSPGTPPRLYSSPILASPASSYGTRKGAADAPGAGRFVMPSEAPSKEQWVADNMVTECMVCKLERFGMFNRRHHCRRCGRVVCAACSTRRTIIRGSSSRTCDDCYEQMFKPKSDQDDQEGLQQRIKERLSGGLGTPSPRVASFTVGSAQSIVEEDEEEQEVPSALADVIHHIEHAWDLALDQDYNNEVRREFYFEHAPSTSLCISILELHSDPSACGRHILALCDKVSQLFKPIAPGVPNPEVDYSLLISILKYLLFNAKVKFLRSGEQQGLAQCDIYQGRVDLLSTLVAANFKDIPSIEQLTKMDAVRRLRDKLIEDERLDMAMEVSTKCGIDPTGVWVAWGMGCLRAGDYSTARDKFSKCLKVPIDRHQVQAPSSLLTEILSCLESAPRVGATGVQALLGPLQSMADLLADPAKLPSESKDMEGTPQYQECLYYLNTYGTHLALISFYRRRGMWTQAVNYLLEKNCSGDVFNEGLLGPALPAGELSILEEEMLSIDPGLVKWNMYLTAACRYLNRIKHFNLLYHFQLFIKDFIRAALTCINCFYEQGAASYGDLFKRIKHLLNAKQHLEAFLDRSQWGHVKRPTPARQTLEWGKGSGEPPVRMIMTPTEVNRQINTITLQIEVTKFLQHYLGNLQDAGVSMTTESQASSGPPPTLFGNNKRKAQVVNMVMLSGNNVNDGFGLAFRIIQDFKLNSTLIYTHAARQLTRSRNYTAIKQLLGCIKDSGLCDDHSFDEVIGACIMLLADDSTQIKEAENLIKMIRLEENKINANILVGKLKSAYLIAVKANRVGDIQRIAGAAQRMGQTAVKSICDKWLQQKTGKS